MINRIIDLHIHSKYSRACSGELELPKIAKACIRKGVNIISTGDFTHPGWMEHIKNNLVEKSQGVYQLNEGNNDEDRRSKIKDQTVEFVLGTEVAVIKKHKDQTRRVHLCIFAPSIEVVEKFNNKLNADGFNLKSDGRPILGLTCKQLLEIMLEIDERMVMIPAHAWTPWFGIFGSKGGYNSLIEAFEDLTPYIKAIETGLSSDPAMNWRLSQLDDISLISNSDAHSNEKIGREANVLQFNNEKEINYKNIFSIINNNRVNSAKAEHAVNNFLHTIEFYPEEGKYHYDGHRDCQFVCSPEETKKYNGICPKCHRELTIGVMNRVHELADRTENEAKEQAEKNNFTPFKSLVPLKEIISDVLSVGVSSKAVNNEYNKLLEKLGSEFNILLNEEINAIEKASSPSIGQAIERVRQGNIFVRPGYDGEFGVVKVFEDNEKRLGIKKQTALEI